MTFEAVCNEISWLNECVRLDDEHQSFAAYLYDQIIRVETAAQDIFTRYGFTMKPFPHFPYYCVTSGPESREIVWQELHSSYFEKYILFSSSGLRQRGRILASFSVREEKLSRILVDPLKQIIPHDLVHGWSQEDQLRELNQNPPGRFWSAFFKVFATPTA